MHHVAIMNKSWKLIPKILSGEKTIESRWYQTKRNPWNAIAAGDTVFFKNAGEPIIAKATVSRVLQFEIKDVNDAITIIKRYGTRICLLHADPRTWNALPKYCILVFLEHPQQIVPFAIDKRGFGNASAWLTVKNISGIKVK